ncbi:histidinol-phosphate transaminase [Streptomyces sp. TS71-3]|uniref:histidinol-phosphate transaminase n=1 Tax=Streptomyces sp. TS71-3 TaxID=2733862 RepID=UPI001B03DD7F|nr:histidinol-phosphate transaminase [Streptomyces sp. TS71-3]GHJ37173.1 putative phenylalanine aminotransferase [Streptomyces sp. TS71-3]
MADSPRSLPTGPYDLSANENPFAPLPGVLETVREAASGVNRYPDPACTELRAALARGLRVPAERVAVGAGSVALIRDLLAEYAAGPDGEVVFAWRGYEGYRAAVRLVGAVPVPVPLRADRHDLAAMAGAVTERTRVVVVCNPNNPTGTVVGRKELDRFLDRLPGNVLAVVDEAYRDFAAGPDAPDAVGTAGHRPGVVVVRTFSKAYGLAGLRVGYAVAHEPVAAALRARALPYGVSAAAQQAAVASLGAREELDRRVAGLVRRRALLVDGLRALGLHVPESHTNFVWLGLGEHTGAFADACREAGVRVKAFPGEGARITVGEPEAVELVIAAASRLPFLPAR